MEVSAKVEWSVSENMLATDVAPVLGYYLYAYIRYDVRDDIREPSFGILPSPLDRCPIHGNAIRKFKKLNNHIQIR